MNLVARLESIPKVSCKKVAIFGYLAVITYILTVILGSIITPNYSNVSQDVSQLTAAGAPARNIINPLFFVYNLLIIEFGLNFYRISSNKSAKVASIFITTIGLLGVLIWLFPIDLRGIPITINGKIHIVIVSVVSLLTVVATMLYGFAYKKSKELKTISLISFAAAILFVVSGPFAAIFVTSPYAGLLERIPIGTFLAWIISISIVLHSKDRCQ